jgi:hypothetical protein
MIFDHHRRVYKRCSQIGASHVRNSLAGAVGVRLGQLVQTRSHGALRAQEIKPSSLMHSVLVMKKRKRRLSATEKAAHALDANRRRIEAAHGSGTASNKTLVRRGYDPDPSGSGLKVPKDRSSSASNKHRRKSGTGTGRLRKVIR